MTARNHDYLRHTLDCLEEAETALHLARRYGQIEAREERDLSRRIGDLTRLIPMDTPEA